MNGLDDWSWMHFVMQCLGEGALAYRRRVTTARPVSAAAMKLRAVSLRQQVARMQRVREMAT